MRQKKVTKTLYFTKEYDKFKFFSFNREIDPAQVNRLVKSISKENLLEEKSPVEVTKDFFIIDGQHRVKACEMLGIEVPFIICEDFSPDHLQMINVASSWGVDDFLRFYAETGKEDYIKLQALLKRLGMPFSRYCNLAGASGGGKTQTKAREGAFVFPADDAVAEILAIYDLSQDLRALFADSLGVARSSFTNRGWYLRVCRYIYLRKDIDKARLLERVAEYTKRFLGVASAAQLLSTLEEVYNMRSRYKVSFDSMQKAAIASREVSYRRPTEPTPGGINLFFTEEEEA